MNKDRVSKIKKKYGADAFKRFGRKGGSPILRAWTEGRIPKSLIKRKKG